MIKSMTGYGRSEFTLDGESGDSYFIEVKSLNHRHLDVKLRLPERFSALEIKIRELFKKNFSRGSFFVGINAVVRSDSALKLNLPVAASFVEAAAILGSKFGIDEKVDVSFLLAQRDVFGAGSKAHTSNDDDMKDDWGGVSGGLACAFKALTGMREQEGTVLNEDISGLLDVISKLLEDIEGRVPEVVEAYREKLVNTINALIQDETVSQDRVITEAAIFAEKTNIAEETVRLAGHLGQMRSYLECAEPVGRRLDFLCQEVLREANTIGSKSQDASISRAVIEIKGELEKVREQVQNIE